MAQRNLLVLLAHGVTAHAHLGEDEVGVGEGGLLIGGDRQLDVQAEVLVQDPVDEHANLALALLVDVVQADLLNLELLFAQRDGLDDTGSEGGAAAGEGDDHGASFLMRETKNALAHV
ncbi:Uncharacterised protein [Collinsella intestinalis]|nr:Uncharacterised protein [Collinsella intestinalis]